MNYFPIDAQTLHYLRQTGRDAAHVARVEAYAKAQGLWHEADAPPAHYSETLALDLTSVEPSLAGPGQPHHRVGLPEVAALVAASIGSIALSQTLWIVSVGLLGIGIASLHMNAVPFYVMLITFALGGNWNWTQAIGAAVVGPRLMRTDSSPSLISISAMPDSSSSSISFLTLRISI
jgi:hypothetical protein